MNQKAKLRISIAESGLTRWFREGYLRETNTYSRYLKRKPITLYASNLSSDFQLCRKQILIVLEFVFAHLASL